MPPKLNRVIRLDSLPLDQTFYTEEGYLRDRPILTRVGIFEYTNPDGSVRRELRLPEDVFDPKSLASYKGKPIIITHDAGLINKDNVHDEGIGTILSEGYRSGDNVRAEIVIHDTNSMRECRLKELSLGYSLDLDETPGEWNGQHYDAIQRNILVNHLALVCEARAGEKARLNIDGRGSKKTLEGGKNMNTTHSKARTDGVMSAEELEQAIADYKAKRAAAPASAADGGVTPPAPAGAEPPKTPETPAPATDGGEPGVAPAGSTIEEKVAAMKEANADCDSNTQKLFDIIDSLLAEREFKEAADGAGCVGPCKTDGDDDGEPKNAPPAAGSTEGGEPEDGRQDNEDDPVPTADEPKMNVDSIDAIVRARVQVGMIGQALNLDGLESMKLPEAKKAIIKAVRPTMNLDGRGAAFIDAAYVMACDEVKSRSVKDTGYQKRQMFNPSTRADGFTGEGSAAQRRQAMIDRTKKNKEDK